MGTQTTSRSQSERESRRWFYAGDRAVCEVTGLSCAPVNPDYWWCPEVGVSACVGYSLFETKTEAIEALRKRLKAERDEVDAALERITFRETTEPPAPFQESEPKPEYLRATHFCETVEEGWRPCPPNLCEAERLAERVNLLQGAIEEWEQALSRAQNYVAANNLTLDEGYDHGEHIGLQRHREAVSTGHYEVLRFFSTEERTRPGDLCAHECGRLIDRQHADGRLLCRFCHRAETGESKGVPHCPVCAPQPATPEGSQ